MGAVADLLVLVMRLDLEAKLAAVNFQELGSDRDFLALGRGADGMPNFNQMPPLASDEQDAAGLAAITAWIGVLPPPAP